ncbi:T9SS type A sorting domain-containing protein, partial [Flavobacterium psychrophilum]|nr:T9SS type A sorting domain-containing protein [Flavobacterium psychrophilum]ELM3651406.1 T9SS type A sorting domain-containing protein [Flavobacterium psychrophilum]ELM3672430.1 T9SS type A sorting domain-containing protein [Flavobacterium psychrophilum]ELM3726963.1 T9SS type A sorting domain-containing protein [Flavobacterium psychrophilum]
NTNFYTIYPNPSNNIVNIDLKDQENQPEKRATITGELFDMMGQSKSKVEISNNKATFSVRGLNKGIYVLKIHINDKVESHQIAVE